MRSLPLKAQLYIVAVWIAGLAVAAGARTMPLPNIQARTWELVLFLCLGAFAGGQKIRLIRSARHEDVGTMSLGFAITFLAMLRFGPAGGLVVAATTGLAGCIYPKRQPVHQLLFNVALTVVEAGVSGVVFMALNGWTLDLSPVGSFPAVIGACFTYFAINTGGVTVVIGLVTGKSMYRLWRDTFLWTAPSYLSGASISALALIIAHNYVPTILVYMSPVALLTYRLYKVSTQSTEEKEKHIEELQLSQAQLADLYLATIKSLALAIDAKDQYTHQHILRVQRYAVATAKQMGLSSADLEAITTGALLHDIGKLGVPEYVLLKPGRLTDEEFAKIKKHPEIGAAILDPVAFPWPVLPVVKYHHEKWNGTGYPEGLKGEEIPLLARILAVGDVYDALTSNRSYRNAWQHEKAVELIAKESGVHFDPAVVEAFLLVIDDVIEDMAKEGQGPLIRQNPASGSGVISKADQAVRDIQRASSELWALYEVAQTLSSSLGLQETLDILARKLEAILPGTACLFLLADEAGECLTVRASIGLNTDFFAEARTLSPQSVSRRVLTHAETYIGEYDPDDLLVASCPTGHWTPLSTALIVPIIHQGQKLGTVNIYHRNADAFSSHDVQLLEMISERAAMALYNGLLFDRTRSHALTDPLTGLHNVRYLTEHVQERCLRAEERIETRAVAHALEPDEPAPARAEDAFALLCLDLDSFKPINDNFGHQKGDQVLRDLGSIFTSLVRPDDVVARYGGDEFLIVLNGAGPEEAEAMGERVQRAVEGYDPGLVHPRLGALRLGASIGFACYPSDGKDCGTLLSTADAHMYGDKTERKLGKLIDRTADRPPDDSSDVADEVLKAA